LATRGHAGAPFLSIGYAVSELHSIDGAPENRQYFDASSAGALTRAALRRCADRWSCLRGIFQSFCQSTPW